MTQKPAKTLKVIGLMSGTSLDGLDIALVSIAYHEETQAYSFDLKKAETQPYTPEWRAHLDKAPLLSAQDLRALDVAYGHYLGKAVKAFLQNHQESADLIASHGHTVFHEPSKGYTLQIGDGNAIKAQTGISTAYDFRSLDVALGGNGAPLVPIGDELLFSEYEVCLNLGGIANASFGQHGVRKAYDICGCNLILNALCAPLGLAFDENGAIASTGRIDAQVLDKLNAWSYCQQKPPKSLDKQQVLDYYFQELKGLNPEDAMATFCEHVAMQIAKLPVNGKLLVTGGGAHNQHLISCIRQFWNGEVVLPSKELIDFKEAVVFAFLGYLRYQGHHNVLASVTGASRDSCGGLLV